MLEVSMPTTTQDALGSPGFARFFLGECVRLVLHAERAANRVTVRAAQVITLTAAPVVHDFIAAVFIFDAQEPRSNLADCRVPIDGLK